MNSSSRSEWLKATALLAVSIALVIGMGAAPAFAKGHTVDVYNLQPSWTGKGGGVYSAYYGPDNVAVSPGATMNYLGHTAGIIKAGQGTNPGADGWDQGLFGFKPHMTISKLAKGPLTYTVVNQSGANPVWMTIEVGNPRDRSANVIYQFIPSTNPASWHTVDAGAGEWQLQDSAGNGSGPFLTLREVAKAASPAPHKVVRVYLRLGMGDGYYSSDGNGTVGWVNNVVIGETTYDFVLAPPSKH